MKRDYWPTEDWRSHSPEILGCDPNELSEIIGSVPEYGNITSVLAVKNGDLVFEEYDLDHESTGCWGLKEGAPPQTAGHYVWSVTKSVLSAVVGAAIDHGYIRDVQQPVSEFLGEETSESQGRQNQLRIRHLLTMTAGLDTNEPRPESQGREMIADCLNRPPRTKPGREFAYDNGAANLLSAIVTVATGMNACEFGKRHLFDPMGLKLDWGSDPAIDTPGGAGIVWTARSMAKFGYLYLNNGRWNDQTLLSESWIKESTKVHTPGGPPCGDDYGYLWWVSEVSGHATYYAAGLHGQKLMIFPELDLVLAITCDQRTGRIRNHIVEKLLKVFGRSTPIQ